MAVNITDTVTNNYTWGNAPLTWTATTKNWPDAGVNTYGLTAAEEIIVVAFYASDSWSDTQSTWAGTATSWQGTRTERLIKTVKKSGKESFAFSDKQNKTISSNPSEGITFKEALKKQASFARKFTEAFIVTMTFVSDSWNDTQSTWAGTATSWEQTGQDELIERFWKEITSPKNEILFSMLEEMYKDYRANKAETVTFVEEYSRVARVKRDFAESFIVTMTFVSDSWSDTQSTWAGTATGWEQTGQDENRERLAKILTANKTEAAIELTDGLIRACEAVLSDIHIEYGDMDVDEFLELVNTPSNYTQFTDFKVGEYEYKEALVRLLVQASVLQSEPSISGVTMYVDIPDTDDRGTVVIKDATTTTKVYYNKFYYTAPEVSVIVIGGNTADGLLTPHLITTSGNDDGGRYFEVEILNSGAVRTTGTISWVSKGY